MTYGIGVMLDKGMIFASDSRTNARVDNFAKFCKLTVFERRDNRVVVLLSSGNLYAHHPPGNDFPISTLFLRRAPTNHSREVDHPPTDTMPKRPPAWSWRGAGGHQACLGHSGGHTWCTCRTCDATVYGLALNSHFTPLAEPAVVRISTIHKGSGESPISSGSAARRRCCAPLGGSRRWPAPACTSHRSRSDRPLTSELVQVWGQPTRTRALGPPPAGI